MMPKGVGSDHTWPGLCEADAWTTLGALFAAPMPSNELAIIKASTPTVLTMVPLHAQDVKKVMADPRSDRRGFSSENVATIRHKIGFATQSAEAGHAVVAGISRWKKSAGSSPKVACAPERTDRREAD